MCYSIFEKTFSYLSWLSLLLILESWVLNLDLDSWKLEPWILILEIKFPLEPWSVLDSILNILNHLEHLKHLELILWLSWIDLWPFCHHPCYHQNIFESILIHHEALLLHYGPQPNIPVKSCNRLHLPQPSLLNFELVDIFCASSDIPVNFMVVWLFLRLLFSILNILIYYGP